MVRDKEKLIERLEKQKDRVQVIIDGLRMLDSGNLTVDRNLTRTVTITLFELIDSLTNLEADIYNFFKRRG